MSFARWINGFPMLSRFPTAQSESKKFKPTNERKNKQKYFEADEIGHLRSERLVHSPMSSILCLQENNGMKVGIMLLEISCTLLLLLLLCFLIT